MNINYMTDNVLKQNGSKDGKWSYSVRLSPTCRSLGPDWYQSCDHVNQILLDDKSCNVTQIQKMK
jgi:hypothetical protein